MKKVIFILILLMPLQAFGSPVTYLEMHSELGDYIGQGLDYYFTEDDGLFSAKQSYYGNSTYENNSISLSFDSFDNSNLWFLDFSTHELGIDLVVGTYDAVRCQRSLKIEPFSVVKFEPPLLNFEDHSCPPSLLFL